MTRRGVFSVITGFIAGFFGIKQAKAKNKPKDVRLYTIQYSNMREGDYPNIDYKQEIIKVTDPKIIDFLDNILRNIHTNKRFKYTWRKNVSIKHSVIKLDTYF